MTTVVFFFSLNYITHLFLLSNYKRPFIEASSFMYFTSLQNTIHSKTQTSMFSSNPFQLP